MKYSGIIFGTLGLLLTAFKTFVEHQNNTPIALPPNTVSAKQTSPEKSSLKVPTVTSVEEANGTAERVKPKETSAKY